MLSNSKRDPFMLRREFLIGTLAISTFSKSVFASADALIVNRTESCGCCGAWVERMISAGFESETTTHAKKDLIDKRGTC